MCPFRHKNLYAVNILYRLSVILPVIDYFAALLPILKPFPQ